MAVPASRTTRRPRRSRTARRRRSKVLASIFEALLNQDDAEELWRLANSQAGYAVQRGDPAAIAQCLSWMAAAAVHGGRFEFSDRTRRGRNQPSRNPSAMSSGRDLRRSILAMPTAGLAAWRMLHERIQRRCRSSRPARMGGFTRLRCWRWRRSQKSWVFRRQSRCTGQTRDVAAGLDQNDVLAEADDGLDRMSGNRRRRLRTRRTGGSRRSR